MSINELENSMAEEKKQILKPQPQKIDLFYIQNESTQNDFYEIDLKKIWEIVWLKKWIIALILMLASMISILIAVSLPDIYRADTLLAQSDDNEGGGLSSMLGGGIGGLASLAGVRIGGNSDKSVIALETMRSRKFLTEFIEKYDLLIPLLATKGWDSQSNELIVDADVYDVDNQVWVRKVRPPKAKVPTLLEAHETMLDLIEINEDSQTGLVKISIEYYSPNLAKTWLMYLVEETNLYLRQQDIQESKNNIAYLQKQLESTSVAQMKSIFSQLIEEQTKIMMLAEGREEYVFKIIDPPVVPEVRSKPNRIIICIIGAMLGIMICTLMVMFKYYSDTIKK